MTASGDRDNVAMAVMVLGVVLAVAATLLPVIQVAGPSGALTFTTWDTMPWFTKLKMVALAMLLAAAFLPRLDRWRVAIAAFAVIMVFLPSISAFISAVTAWSEVRGEIIRQTGNRAPFVHPGLANLALVAAGSMVAWASWRMQSRRPGGAPALAPA